MIFNMVVLPLPFNVANAAKSKGLSILRDAEIEQTIRDLTEAIFVAAGLDVNSVSTYLVNDSTLNAFVMGGQNIFINSGLILRAENPNQLMGVVAHETGHISGGHLSRFEDGLSEMTNYSILGVLLGAAAIAAGSADAGMALITGGQHIGYRRLLAFTRTQESSADQAGLTYMEKIGQSGQGLLDFLEILGEQDLVPAKYQDPYARTHPISSTRIAQLQDRVNESPYVNVFVSRELNDKFDRLQAKLFGYLKPLHATLVKYPVEDKSALARYARTFAYNKEHKIELALEEINALIEMEPENAYFYESKGQILFENGDIEKSIPPYRKSVELMPSSSLLRVSLSKTLISTEDNQYLDEAIENLEKALEVDPENSFGWHQASMAYHRADNKALTYYTMAQLFILTGNLKGAMINAKNAVDLLPEKSPKWVKAKDIMVVAENNLQDQQHRNRLNADEDRKTRITFERQQNFGFGRQGFDNDQYNGQYQYNEQYNSLPNDLQIKDDWKKRYIYEN